MAGSNGPVLLRSNDFWYDYFVDELMPHTMADEELRRNIKTGVVRQSETRPNWTSIRHYLAKSYGLSSADADSLEQFLNRSIRSIGVTEHAARTFARERISWVLVDHSMETIGPNSKMKEFPEGKKKWTHPITHLLLPKWAEESSAETAGDAAAAVVADLRIAKKNGCSGFKSHQAYFRDLALADVSEDEATEALRLLKKNPPKCFHRFPVLTPNYESGSVEAEALRKYQDFILKTIFCEAGRMRVPMLIHIAATLTPSLKTWNNDPAKLYTVLDNDDVRRTGTTFFLLHTGFPEHHKITSLISQYPNVYVDLSWISCNTLYVCKILDEYLSIASSTKVTHGSDTSNVDLTAYAAHNTRMALSQFAAKLQNEYSWSEGEIYELAENVLYKNADRIFGPNS